MFRVQQSLKKVILTFFWNMKGLVTIDFLEKGPTVNSASYFQLFMQNSPYSMNDPHTDTHIYKD